MFHSGNVGAIAVSLAKYTILMWYGTLASIPPGWQICDGTNGTPDLRGYFVRGALAGQPGDNAAHGSEQHDHGGVTDIPTGNQLRLTGALNTPSTGHTHAIAPDDNIPPYKHLVFIMKL